MPETMKREWINRVIARSAKWLGVVVLLFAALPAAAQKYPERSLVRQGNRAFEKGKFDRSIDRYREAGEVAPESWEATYNLGNALYRTEQYDKAAEALRRAAVDSLRTPEERAEAYYNLADVQYKQQKLPEALESLKSSLRLNPADEDAKYNYTLIKRQLQNEQKDQDQQDQQQNQEQQDQEQQDQPQNQEQQPQEQQGDPEEQQAEPQPQEGALSEQEMEQMLEAIQVQEDETQEKLKEKKAVLVKGSKNW